MKVLVYTCNLCRRDVLPIIRKQVNVDYRCFTDESKLNAGRGWFVSELYEKLDCPTQTARWHKMQPHTHSPGYDFYVWVDAHVVPCPGLATWVKSLGKFDIAAFSHRVRKDPYDEIREVRRLGLESRKACRFAKRKLKESAYPRKGGLHETTILVMRNTDRVQFMLDGWWGGLWESTGKRDQLHFNRVVRDHELELKTLKGNVRENDFFHWFSHPHPASAETQRLQKQWTGKTRKKKS